MRDVHHSTYGLLLIRVAKHCITIAMPYILSTIRGIFGHTHTHTNLCLWTVYIQSHTNQCIHMHTYMVIDKYKQDLVMSYEMHIACPVCGNLSV